jgi:hypothetical protein
VCIEIEDINLAIERAENAKKEAAIKATIKQDKYLCIKRKDWQTGKYVYAGHERITKVCEKTVSTRDPWGYNRRYKIGQLIYSLQHNLKYIVDNKEVTPPEESDSE